MLRHERSLSFGALALGFTVDSLTLTRIDQKLDNAIFIAYLLIAGLSITLFHYLKDESRIRLFLPYLLQYAFGGLFSGFFILYTRSGSLATSWPFIITLLYLLIGNETFKERYEKYVFRMSVYFIALYLFFIFFIPVLIAHMGDLVFILSGIASILAIAGLTKIIERSSKTRAEDKRNQIYIMVIIITLLINTLYFSRIIPPIPLSLKDIAVSYSLERTENQYILTQEKLPWWQKPFTKDFHISEPQELYVYSAVFAPTNLDQTITHVWSHKTDNGWVTRSQIAFDISGGRGEGYRGYSRSSMTQEGLWRVDVRTTRGQLIGRKTFSISFKAPQELETIVK